MDEETQTVQEATSDPGPTTTQAAYEFEQPRRNKQRKRLKGWII